MNSIKHIKRVAGTSLIRIVIIVCGLCLLIGLLSGFGEKVEKTVAAPDLETVDEKRYELPAKVLSDDFPAEHKVVYTDELSVADFKGDGVYAETDEFFVVDGERQQVVRLNAGVNTVYLIRIVNGKERLYKKKLLLLSTFQDVGPEYPYARAIQYVCMLRIMGPYVDEGKVFLPEHGVPKKEFSLILKQAVQENPKVVSFTRIGGKEYIDLASALAALENNFGKPLRPWQDILGKALEHPKQPITRGQLAAALTYLKYIHTRIAELVKGFRLEPLG